MSKPISQKKKQDPASIAVPSRKSDSPWTEGDISMRTGNCNVLLIAPHGHPKNDEKTYEIARLAANKLDCYAILTKIYRKPFKKKGSDERRSPDKSKKWVNLNRINEVHEHLESEFEKPLLDIVKDITIKFGKTLIIWIHGIGDGNLTPENTDGNIDGINALIGMGQGDPKRYTVYKKTANKIVCALAANSTIPLKAALAKRGSNYCGWYKNNMNQYFKSKKYSLQKVESIQIEINKIGFREDDNFQNTAIALADSLSGIAVRPASESEPTTLVSADQSGTIQQIQVDEIDGDSGDFGQFMSRLDDITSDTAEFKRLVDSIKRHGVLNPVIVRKRNDTDGKPYQLISGFRRLTALKASINRKDLDGATVPARVLKDSVTDDEAYQISFTENLARQDLSLWEIAKACAKIRDQKIAEGGMSKGQIEKHLAELIPKDTRTVRRYLKLASIKDDEIKKAIHYGNISPTTALEIGKKDLVKDEPENISVLLNYLRNNPKTTREFERVYGNLEYCCECSKLSLAAVLECKNADGFLSLEKDELEKRIENLHSKTGKKYPDILKGKAGSLLKDTFKIDDGLKRKDAGNKFKAQNKDIIDRVHEAFKQSKISGKFKIKPASGTGENRVTVTITVPENKMWQAIDVVSTANISQAGRVVRRKESKKRPSKFVSPASNSVEKPESIIKDESKTVYRGSFKK